MQSKRRRGEAIETKKIVGEAAKGRRRGVKAS
jgi:hypothetical protein